MPSSSRRPLRLLSPAVVLLLGATAAAAQTLPAERRIGQLLDDPRATYVSLAEADFRSLGAGFDLPDGGRAVTALAAAAPGGAFDPRDVARIPKEQLGYQAEWIVERYRRYNLDWDIGALKLTSNDPGARDLPWFIVMNGGAANFYEFFVDLKNRPGWTQYLAQKVNVMVITIPGNFRYGGWELPVAARERQPAYLLDRDLTLAESEARNAVYTNSLILQGVKALVTEHTSGDVLLIGHSTSGEISMLAYEDPELAARLRGRYFGWGSGGAARLDGIFDARAAAHAEDDAVVLEPGAPITQLARRDPPTYARGYSGVLNPLYEPGMSHLQIAERWLAAEARRRANFKQRLQDLEHSANVGLKGSVEHQLERLLAESGNPWGIPFEEVARDLFSTNYTRLDGFRRMVWTTAHFDRNHWVPENPMASVEVRVADEYRARNPAAEIRLINWDLPMTHYGHLELPRELAAAHYAVLQWLVRP